MPSGPSDPVPWEARLSSLGLSLPPPPVPKGAYVPVVEQGGFAWVSGMLPLVEGKLRAQGLVDGEVTIPVAQECARLAVLGGLSALNHAIGGLDRVARFIRVGVFVASSPQFVRQPEVANGASELLRNVWGDRGAHARAAVGTTRLPLDSPVEVELLVALQ